jgi:hypothetical protein
MMSKNPPTAPAAASTMRGTVVLCTSNAMPVSKTKENAENTLNGVIIALRIDIMLAPTTNPFVTSKSSGHSDMRHFDDT